MTNASSIQTVLARVELIHKVMEKIMQKDIHYGIIPGTTKPTLLKPGAEVLATTFQLAPTVTTEIDRTADAIRVTTHVSLHSIGGQFLGEGVGECSTGEEKFKWRAALSDAEFMSVPEDKKRVTYKKAKGGGVYTVKQIRQNPDDMANTVLKMAKKRAFVDAILTVTGASDIFTQDVEDMDIPVPTEKAVPKEGEPEFIIPEPENDVHREVDTKNILPGATLKELIKSMYDVAGTLKKTTKDVHQLFHDRFGVDKYTELNEEQVRELIVLLGS
jgi:hypothetical protein